MSSASSVRASDEGWSTHYAVNGFVNTGPADPYQIFKIQYRVLNGTVEQFSMPYVDVAHNIRAEVTSDGDGVLQIKFPKNYPNGNDELGGSAIVFVNEQEIVPNSTETDCFSEFSLPFSNDAVIDVVWGFYDDFFRGADVAEGCMPETIVQDVVRTKDGVIPPLQQLKAGVTTEEVVCGYGFELIRHPDGRPYCATPSSVEQLYNRWNKLPPPSPPVAQYPLLGNVTSFISTPFTIVQNQKTAVEFTIQNDNDFALYDVKIHNFSTANIPLILSNTYFVENLAPHETRVVTATLTTDPGYPETGTSFLFWTLLAKDRSGTAMESTMFQRQVTVIADDNQA